MATQVDLDVGSLREAIRAEYAEVAEHPDKGFHFHTGRTLAGLLGYRDEWLAGLPEAAIESFAGTGNPFSLGELRPGERVVDVGSGAGLDSLIAARMVGPTGRVIGVDMTAAMLAKARRAAAEVGATGLCLAGGVAANSLLRERWLDACTEDGLRCFLPSRSLCTDNAAMVAAAGWWRLRSDGATPLDVGADPNLKL